MKFSVVAAVAAGAALASATPLRVIVVSSNINAVAEPGSANTNNPWSHARFGHAVNPNVAEMAVGGGGRAPDARWPFPGSPPPAHPIPHMWPGPPCGMRRPGGFKQKAIEISNAFRKTFGLPLIETDLNVSPIFHHGGGGGEGKEIHGGMVHIMPFIGTPVHGEGEVVHHHNPYPGPPPPPGPPPSFPPGSPPDQHHGHPHHPPPPPPPFFWPPPPPPHRHHHHGGGHHRHMMLADDDSSFMLRLQNALMSLGPWEGRAVAFVVGAGLGVLLRMFWVLGVVAYRGCSSDRDGYAAVNNDGEDDDSDDDDDNVVLGTRYSRRTPVSAPPQYVYPVDEKVRVEEAVTTNNNTDNTTETQKSPVQGEN
ncbi:hypothetical protein MD484_g5138, partial [Candolleomyces efflorescens]